MIAAQHGRQLAQIGAEAHRRSLGGVCRLTIEGQEGPGDRLSGEGEQKAQPERQRIGHGVQDVPREQCADGAHQRADGGAEAEQHPLAVGMDHLGQHGAPRRRRHADGALREQQHGHQKRIGEPPRCDRPQHDAETEHQPRHALEHADPHDPRLLALQGLGAPGHEELRHVRGGQVDGRDQSDQHPRLGQVADVERQDGGDEDEAAGQVDERQVADVDPEVPARVAANELPVAGIGGRLAHAGSAVRGLPSPRIRCPRSAPPPAGRAPPPRPPPATRAPACRPPPR